MRCNFVVKSIATQSLSRDAVPEEKYEKENVQLRMAISSGHDANKYLPVALVISSFASGKGAALSSTRAVDPPARSGNGSTSHSLSLSFRLISSPSFPLLSPIALFVEAPRKKQRNASPFSSSSKGSSAARTFAYYELFASSIFVRRSKNGRDNSSIGDFSRRCDPIERRDSQDLRSFFRGRDATQRCPAARPRWLSRALGPPYIDPTLAKLAKRERLYFFLSHSSSLREHGDSRGRRFVRDNEVRPSFFLLFLLFLLSRDTCHLRSPLEPIRREKQRRMYIVVRASVSREGKRKHSSSSNIRFISDRR